LKKAASISKKTLFILFILYPIFVLFWYKGYFILILSGLLLVVINQIVLNNGRLWLGTRTAAVYVFFLLPIISVLWSHYPEETLWRGSLVLINIGIFYLMLTANRYDAEIVISKLVIIVPFITLIVFMIIYMVYGSIRPDTVAMDEQIHSISNDLPALVVLCVPYLLMVPGIVRSKILIWGAVAASLFVVLLSQSRGGLMMILLSILMSIFMYPDKRSIRIIKFAKLSVAAILITAVMVFSFGLDRLVMPVIDRFENSQLTSLNGFINPTKGGKDYRRAVMYSEGINAIYEEPILGIGYGSLSPYIEKSYIFSIVSHNLIITSLGEMGIPGLMVLLWLMFSIVVGLRNYRGGNAGTKKDKYFAAATLAALIVAFAHAQFRPLYSNPMVPVLLAQAYTMMRFTRKRRGDFRLSLFSHRASRKN